MDKLSDRNRKILKIIVEQYNKKYEPISSQLVSSLFNEKVSSQTIRNCMAQLEKNGYLLKIHTSSGRVPSKIALDYFAKNLSKSQINTIIRQRLESVFNKRNKNIDSVINDSLMILNEITHLPSLVNTRSQDENLCEISLVQLNTNNALVIIVTNFGNIYKHYLYINNETQINDIKTCIKLFNQHLIGTPIFALQNKIQHIIPIVQKEVVEYEYVTREIIAKLFNSTLKNFHRTNVVGMTSLSEYPEFQDPKMIFKILDMVEHGTIWQQIQNDMDNLDNVKIEYKSVDNQDKNKTFLIATTEINYENVCRQISIIGPSRTDLSKVKGALNYLRDQIERMFKDNKNNSDI